MNWEPHVTVAVVVMRSGANGPQFLTVEETTEHAQLVYNQPAGHVEKGETLEQAAVREALEETGWQVQLTGFLGFYVYTPPSNPHITYYRACFLANAVQHDSARPLDTGIVQALWLSRSDLASSQKLRSPLVLKCVDDALAGKNFPLNIVYEHPL